MTSPSGLGSKGVRPARCERLSPLVYRLRGHGETTRDFSGANSLTKETESFQTAFLEDERIPMLLGPACPASR